MMGIVIGIVVVVIGLVVLYRVLCFFDAKRWAKYNEYERAEFQRQFAERVAKDEEKELKLEIKAFKNKGYSVMEERISRGEFERFDGTMKLIAAEIEFDKVYEETSDMDKAKIAYKRHLGIL